MLVADDEQVIANTLAIILNQAGFEARAVYSGEKVLESLDAFQPFLAPFILGTRRMSEAPAATPSKPRVLVADDEQIGRASCRERV